MIWLNKYINRKEKDYYYYTYFLKYQNLDYYLKMYNTQDAISVPYQFINNASLLKLKKSDIIRKFGRPMFQEYSGYESNHFVIFYSIKYLKYNIIKSFHFFNNEVFFINKTFQRLKDVDKEQIFRVLENKYKINFNKKNKKQIVDTDGVILFVEDVFELSINYLLPSICKVKDNRLLKEQNLLNIQKQEETFLTHLFDKII